jgi:hypothetical protein
MSTATSPHPADAVANALKRYDPQLSETLLDALEHLDASDDLDPALWGPAPSRDEYLGAVLRDQRRLEAARVAVLEDSLTRRQAADRLGVSPQRVSALVDDGELVALDDGQLRLPGWQFDPDTPRGRLPGLARLQSAFPGGPVSLTLWATRPNPALGQRTPARALASGDLDDVFAAAIWQV